MDEKNNMQKTALSSNEDFFRFLAHHARSQTEEQREQRRMAEQGIHPLSEELDSYIKGVLNKEDEKTVGDHIALCGICADKALKISCAGQETGYFFFDRLYERCSETLKKLIPARSKFMWGLASGFSVAVVCLLLFWGWSPSLPDSIHQSYQTVLAQKLSFENDDLNEIIKFPWEKEVDHLAFGASNRNAPLYRAFGAGLWTGRRELGFRISEAFPGFLSPGWPDSPGTEPDKWSEMPQWSACFQMGQWCFLMQTVCVSGAELSDAFWEEQRIIMDKIWKDFAAHTRKSDEDDRFVNDRLEKIRSVLERLDSHPGRKERRIIADETESLIGHLSPQIQN